MDEKKIELSHVEQLEQGLASERARRIDQKVERGEAIRQKVIVVCAAEDDSAAALEREKIDALTKLRTAGEKREVVWDVLQIFTGVPRPSLDDLYAARLARDYAAESEERRRQREAEAAKQLDAFHEAARSHEPEPTPAPMPVPIDVVPADDLEWHHAVVQMTGPTNGSLGSVREGTFAVSTRDAIRVLYVRNDAGSHIDTRLLHEGEEAKTIAKSLLRDHYMKRHNSFYDPISYPEKSIY
jgi:hypothetical protein